MLTLFPSIKSVSITMTSDPLSYTIFQKSTIVFSIGACVHIYKDFWLSTQPGGIRLSGT